MQALPPSQASAPQREDRDRDLISWGPVELSRGLHRGSAPGSTWRGSPEGQPWEAPPSPSHSSKKGIRDSSRSFLPFQPPPRPPPHSLRAALKPSPQKTCLPPPGPSEPPPVSLSPAMGFCVLLTHTGGLLSALLFTVRLHESRDHTGPRRPRLPCPPHHMAQGRATRSGDRDREARLSTPLSSSCQTASSGGRKAIELKTVQAW